MRAAALLLTLLLAAPLAGATVPLPARCNSVYCFSLLDEDGDGAPDGIVGGTASVLHEAPTVSFAWTAGGFFVAGEVPVGHEDDDPLAVLPYVGGERDGTSVRVVHVGVDVLQLDSEDGTESPILSVFVQADDADGDGVPEKPTYGTLP